MDLDEARKRFRTTLEIDGVPAFWEDQLFGGRRTQCGALPHRRSEFRGSNPCARCPGSPA